MKCARTFLGAASLLAGSTAFAVPIVSFNASTAVDAGFSYKEPNLIIEDHAVQDSDSANSQPGTTSFNLFTDTPIVQLVQTLKDPADDPALQVVQTWNTSATASVTGSVGFGELHADLTAQTRVDFLATLEGTKPDPNHPGETTPFSKTFVSPIGAEASAFVRASSFDLLSVDPTEDHGAGSLVPVRLTLVVHAVASTPLVTELAKTFSGNTSIDVTTSIWNRSGSSAVVNDLHQQLDGAFDLTETGTVDVPVGSLFPVSIDLTAAASAGGVVEGLECNYICSVAPGELASLDIGNTVQLFLDPLSDFTITSQSGHDYGTPSTPVASVPEPPTVPLLLSGVLGLGWLKVRRRPSAQG